MITKTIGKEDMRAMFPDIPKRANKGEMGRVLVVCGSYDPRGLAMCGAAYFATKAAYLCGAGIVEIFTPRENYSALASLVPEAIFSLYGYDEGLDEVKARVVSSVKKSDSVVLGCGLGKSEISKVLVEAVLSSVDCPLVIDADGLNILAENDEYWSHLGYNQRKMTVITPHPGEMSRLCGKAIPDILDDISGVAQSFADEKGIICLLKDHNTAVSDGQVTYVNHSGNAGMATAGMGDVLAGIIGALLVRSTDAEGDVLCRVAAGAHLHGCAGDKSARKIGQYSLVASELLAEIPSAIVDFFG